MIEIKKTQRSIVQRLGSGHYRKSYLWDDAKSRFTNEVAVLLHLEEAGCEFVPKLISACAGSLTITTSDCGLPVQQLPEQKIKELYARLEQYGVRHEDPELRNIVYNSHIGQFSIIDFEFAELLHPAVDAETVLQDLFTLGFEAQSVTKQNSKSLELQQPDISVPSL